MLIRNRLMVLLAVLTLSVAGAAQRDPVLKQIDVPHRYYYREMYLPQLTSGPSSVAWTPDSRSLVYSMAGSLWLQRLDSQAAEQLTAGPGYDYQPDCSRDGRWIVYSSYQHDAMELWALDLNSRKSVQLTSGGAVNVDPRFSPDGRRVVFVSTSFQGHFHIFVGDFEQGRLTNVQRLTGETRSDMPRFYYSPIDHEISPAWSPDGSEIAYISNRGHIYGTGGIWRMPANPGAEAREIHYEETTWKAHPEFSPDGKRLVYASYLGQAWHQLWLIPSQGGYAFPISYGNFDNLSPRWSPDGKRIAFISNRSGNTSLWTQEVLGGAQTQIVARERRYLHPMGRIAIKVTDATGHAMPARVFVTGEDQRAYAPDDAWVYAEDNFVRSEKPYESHYFHCPGGAEITVPSGNVNVTVARGIEYQPETRRIPVAAGQVSRLTFRLSRLRVPEEAGSRWVSGDLHVHMNYGGSYRNTPEHLVATMAAEDLPVLYDLVVNKEQRIPDISYFSTKPDPASTTSNLLLYGQEFHTSYWGHLGLLNLTRNYLLPDYATYDYTAAASLFPSNADVADLAHAQGALVGYVHPFDWAPDPVQDPTLTHGAPADAALELPVDVALGKVDYIEAMGFSDHKSTAEIWYRLLNCGFRLPTGAGTDAMANFASLRGPIGLNRVYAKVAPGPRNLGQWLEALKQGHTFATNGPLVGFSLGSRQIGEELKLHAGKNKVPVKAWMRSIVPVDRLQVVCNGRVVQEAKLSADRKSADLDASLSLADSGWCLLRAVSDKPEFPVLDSYIYATTSPIYVSVEGSQLKSAADANFFMNWIDRLIAYTEANKDWNTEAERASVMETLNQARAVYAQMSK